MAVNLSGHVHFHVFLNGDLALNPAQSTILSLTQRGCVNSAAKATRFWGRGASRFASHRKEASLIAPFTSRFRVLYLNKVCRISSRNFALSSYCFIQFNVLLHFITPLVPPMQNSYKLCPMFCLMQPREGDKHLIAARKRKVCLRDQDADPPSV